MRALYVWFVILSHPSHSIPIHYAALLFDVHQQNEMVVISIISKAVAGGPQGARRTGKGTGRSLAHTLVNPSPLQLVASFHGLRLPQLWCVSLPRIFAPGSALVQWPNPPLHHGAFCHGLLLSLLYHWVPV